MTRKKQLPEVSLVRSSAAEYLTFVAATGSQQQAVEMRYEDENVSLSQKMKAQLYDVEVPTISYHLKKVFEDSELPEPYGTSSTNASRGPLLNAAPVGIPGTCSHSCLLGSTARRPSPKQPGPGAMAPFPR